MLTCGCWSHQRDVHLFASVAQSNRVPLMNFATHLVRSECECYAIFSAVAHEGSAWGERMRSTTRTAENLVLYEVLCDVRGC
jgi:hypothetical protein